MDDHWQSFAFKNAQERAGFSALCLVPGVGRTTLHRLITARIKHNTSFGKFLGKRLPEWLLKCMSKKQIDSCENFRIEHNNFSIAEYENKHDLHLITLFDDNYPALLRSTDDPPLLLFVRGTVGVLSQQKMIAVVGTRRMTAYGHQATQYLVSDLVAYGWGVASGAMYGIDAAAHQACIDAGGCTIAVLGYGFNQIPRAAQPLLNAILVAGGCLVSEFSPDTSPKAGNFPLRNRIVAGLSQAVIVVEAARKSGSHITAQCGLDAGRVVAAVPGSIFSPYSQGTKWLLQQGAVCIATAADLLSELQLYPEEETSGKRHMTRQLPYSPNSIEQKIYDMLLTQPCSTQVLASQLAVPIAQLVSALSTLELAGYIARTDTMWSVIL